MNSSNACPICTKNREVYFEHKILKKYNVKYYFCTLCGLLQTETPYWLEEAYANAIADADTGLVARNISISKKLSNALFFLFDKNGKYLDAAGGYGMLTRLMRDIGYDFYWSDPYCDNVLAKGFDVSTSHENFEAVTAFEVLEHITDPIKFIHDVLKEHRASTFIFSTELFSETPPNPGDWYYYSFGTGQHISFYQTKTLNYIAHKLSLNFYSKGSFHIFTSKEVALSNVTWRILTGKFSEEISFLVEKKMKSKSKTFTDYESIISC